VVTCDVTAAFPPSGNVVAALDYVEAAKLAEPAVPMVTTLSVSVTGVSYSLNAAIADLRAVGVPSVVAAGNSDNNACAVTPANAPGALTVGASTIGGLDPVTAMIPANADLDFIAAYGGGLCATRASVFFFVCPAYT